MQSAQTWARTQLSKLYALEYRKLYLEHRETCTGINRNATARNKAISSLVFRYRNEYRSLYNEGLSLGFPGRLKKEREVRV